MGQVDYLDAWDLQKERVAARHTGAAQHDHLFLLEHPPVYTLGRSGQREHVLQDPAAAPLPVYEVDRGGDVTYHGPGQLVGYPILDIKELHRRHGLDRLDLHRYLRDLESVLIGTLATFSIHGWRYEGYTGVWVDGPAGPLKIAAIGIKVSSRGISSHGFALNVDPDLSHFAGIVPCGIAEHGVTSMAELLPRAPLLKEVIPVLLAAVAEVFAVTPRLVPTPQSAYNQPTT